ncbi:MAG TPA: nitroreductase family protein, partial [Chloroflexota bacterium]
AVMANSLRASLRSAHEDIDEVELERLVERERLKPLRAPVVIAVAVAPSDNPKAVEIEEIASVAAGIQNMLLAAEALGLGAMWRTGRPARDPAVKRFLGFPENAHLLAFVYLGYPDLPEHQPRRRSAQQLIRWLGWESD